MLKKWLESKGLTHQEFINIMDSIMEGDIAKLVFNDEPAHAPSVRLSWLDDRAPIEVHKETGIYFYAISDKSPKLIRAENKNTVLFVRYGDKGIRIVIKDSDAKTLLCANLPFIEGQP